MNEPSLYIERNINNPFRNLESDEKILANIALVYKEMLKWEYEEYLGYDLDDLSTFQQMSGTSSNKSGGLEWYNYMYSDRYKDDEGLKKDHIDVGGKDPHYWARLSVFEALRRFVRCVEGWEDCVMLMGFWYEKNIHTYQLGRQCYTGGPCNLFPDPFSNHTVRDDCTGYVCACILLYTATIIYKHDEELANKIFKGFSWAPSSELWSTKDSPAQKTTELAGFEIIPFSLESLQPFDIVMGNMKNGVCKGHHGEIYAGTFDNKRRSWGWGSVHDESHGGMPAGFVNYTYDWIFRLNGIKKYSNDEAKEMIALARESLSIPSFDYYQGKKAGNNNEDNTQQLPT